MRTESEKVIHEYDGLISGQMMLFLYRVLNLCIKADGTALLPVKIVIKGDSYNIEDVAQVTNPNDVSFCVIPMDEKNLPQIAEGVKKVHPELKVELKKVTNKGFEDVNEGMDGDDDSEKEDKSPKVLLVTVPEMNKDRHDATCDAIDALYQDCKTQMEAYKGEYSAKLSASLAEVNAQEADEMKKSFEEVTSTYVKMRDAKRDEKKKQVDDAYALYQSKQQKKEEAKKEEELSQGKDAVKSMNIFEQQD